MNQKDNTLFYNLDNHIECIELSNIIKTQGFFGLKERFAVLTQFNLFIFENHFSFLNKINPRVFYLFLF